MVLRLSEACEKDGLACVCSEEPHGEHFCKVAVEADREALAKELRVLQKKLGQLEYRFIDAKSNKAGYAIWWKLNELADKLEGK